MAWGVSWNVFLQVSAEHWGTKHQKESKTIPETSIIEYTRSGLLYQAASTLHKKKFKTQQSMVILDLYLRKTLAGKYRNHESVFKKLL